MTDKETKAITVLVPYDEGFEGGEPLVYDGHLGDDFLRTLADELGSVEDGGYARSHVEDNIIWFENDTGEGPFETYEACEDSGSGTLGDLIYVITKTHILVP